MATVSILIPAFNAATTLPRTLESVLDQTYQDFDVWVVDDGSTDDTAQGVAQFIEARAESRIHLLQQPNSGAAIARNQGIAHSTGALVTFLDADDYWTPDKLEAQVAALAQHPAAAVAYSWTDYVNEQGKFLYPGGRDRYSGNVYTDLFRHNFIESGSNLMVRRSALEQVGGFEPTLTSAHDWELWLRLAERYEFVLVPQAQICYRVGADSISSNVARQEQNSRRVVAAALTRSPAQLAPYRRASLANLYQYFAFRAMGLAQTRWDYLQSLRYLVIAGFYGPQRLGQRSRLMAILITKIILGLLLSPPILHRVLRKA